MAKYGVPKYGASRYGNTSLIKATTAGFKTAQAELVRTIYSSLYIVSHFRQIGLKVTYPSTVFIGGLWNRRVAQKFIASKTYDCTGLWVMMKGASTNTGKIIVEIQTDNAGEPSGTAVTNASRTDLDAVIYGTQSWVQVKFNQEASLTAGETYWIVIWDDETTNDITYIGADDKGANDEPSLYTTEDGIYGTFKYGSGIKYGAVWSERWAETDYLLLCRLISSVEADNLQEITQMVGWSLKRDRDIACYEFSAQAVNKDYQFSIGQVHHDWLTSGKKIECYLGFDVSGTPVQYLTFIGETDDSPASGDVVQLNARCMMKKLVDHSGGFDDLSLTAYEDMIQSVAEDAGITSYSLRVTGRTSGAGLTFYDLSSFDVADKVRQATLDRMQFYNTETITTTERARASVSEASVPTYELSEDDFLLGAEIELINDKMINRATVVNDEDGETTSDGNTITLDAYQSIGTGAGNLTIAEKTKAITITLTEHPVMHIQVSDNLTDCEIISVDIDCGTSAVAGSVVVTLKNLLYGSDKGDYDLVVKGCPITNAGATTVVGETIDWTSWSTYGKFSDRIDNKMICGKTDVEATADAIIAEKAYPIEMIKAKCRGIVDIYPDDIVRFIESRKTYLDHLGIVVLVELEYQKDPASFTMNIEAEKTNYVGS